MANEGILTKDYQNLTRDEREIYDHELDMIRVAQCAKTFDYNKGKEDCALEIARSMKSDGLPIDTIMKCTNLSQEEIDAL